MSGSLRIACMMVMVMLVGASAAPAKAAFPFGDSQTIAPLLKEVTPAVVNIAVRSHVRVENPLLNDPFFRRFFNVPQGPGLGVTINKDLILA